MSKDIILLYIEHNSGVNGLVKVLTNMANEFCNRKYNVTIVTSGSEKNLPFFLDSRVQWIKLGLSDIKYNAWDKIKREVNRCFIFCDHPYRIKKANLAASKLNVLLGGKKVTSIICYDHEAVLVANRLHCGRQVPIIAMMHNYPGVILKNLNKAGIKEENKVAVHQVLMPSYVENARKYLSTDICYIPNVVQESDILLQRNNNTIISIGRLDPLQKRTDILIKSFGKISRLYPDWKVYIYGKAEISNQDYEKELRRLISELHLDSRVFLCGTTSNVMSVLCEADIFAFPSAYEGFPLALTEAMSIGLPSVGFRSANAVNELIHHNVNGILCNDGIENFAMGLSTLMNSKALRKKLGDQAKVDMMQYKSNKIWDMWEKLICKYMNKK